MLNTQEARPNTNKRGPQETYPHETGSRHTHTCQPRRPPNRRPQTTSDHLGRGTREAGPPACTAWNEATTAQRPQGARTTQPTGAQREARRHAPVGPFLCSTPARRSPAGKPRGCSGAGLGGRGHKVTLDKPQGKNKHDVSLSPGPEEVRGVKGDSMFNMKWPKQKSL
jgi:hypothetical protein